MRVDSVVRQWNLVAIAAVFVLPLGFGVVSTVAALVGVAGFGWPLVVGGTVLVLVSAAMILACAVSLTIRSTVGPDGIGSGEIGGRWSLGWADIAYVWLVTSRGQSFLAVQPAGAPTKIRTAWRSRRFGLPETARTVRVDETSVPAIAQAVHTYRGVPPESWSA